jgi:hypothetical protein
MIVGHEFLDDLAQVPLAEEDEMVQALVFDGFDKPLRMQVALRTLRTSLGLGGRPHLASELSYFLAASWRNQARIVSGFTSRQHLRRSSGVSCLPAVARRRRWSVVNASFLPPVVASSCSCKMRCSSST